MAESVIVLMEAADRAMDTEHIEMQDWSFVLSYIISDNWLKLLSTLS
jgi:hypothetical protein